MANSLWNTLRARLLPARRRGPRRIALQHVMSSDEDIDTVRAVLDGVGEALDVEFELRAGAGDIVLMDADLAGRMSPQLVHAFTEERPLVTLTSLQREDELLLPLAERFERRQRELLAQLREIPFVRRAAGGAAAPVSPQDTAGFDSGFDTRAHATELLAAEIEEGRRELMQRVLRGRHAHHLPPLTASYGPGAHLRFDFAAQRVSIDALALQHLRVRRELPRPAPGAQPQEEATLRDLDQTVWDLGLAAGPHALLDEPGDWWHTALVWTAGARLEHYSRLPRYLALAQYLKQAPRTPSQLRRHARVGVADLRCFLQATLMLGLTRWQPTDRTTGTLP
jgi:hypothetical protein